MSVRVTVFCVNKTAENVKKLAQHFVLLIYSFAHILKQAPRRRQMPPLPQYKCRIHYNNRVFVNLALRPIYAKRRTYGHKNQSQHNCARRNALFESGFYALHSINSPPMPNLIRHTCMFFCPIIYMQPGSLFNVYPAESAIVNNMYRRSIFKSSFALAVRSAQGRFS